MTAGSGGLVRTEKVFSLEEHIVKKHSLSVGTVPQEAWLLHSWHLSAGKQRPGTQAGEGPGQGTQGACGAWASARCLCGGHKLQLCVAASSRGFTTDKRQEGSVLDRCSITVPPHISSALQHSVSLRGPFLMPA